MADMTEKELIETITRKLIALRSKDFDEEFERNGLEDWDNEIDMILSGEQVMIPAEQLAFGVYVARWWALNIVKSDGFS